MLILLNKSEIVRTLFFFHIAGLRSIGVDLLLVPGEMLNAFSGRLRILCRSNFYRVFTKAGGWIDIVRIYDILIMSIWRRQTH